ncbi:HAMP domain-containing sensor histidine kinase [Blautia marasmi]|uniref:HAMP domain-containing sensor histidine kinase n=1 Tax=Blautia marasmi TaxID=1917868 RepID=UPI00266CBF1E|nr:HAMP domain-containing sensor histidine kinase [Blautia marasmi]
MEKIKNLSLRKTIILYVAAALILTFFISAGIILTAEKTQKHIWIQYTDRDILSGHEVGYGYTAEVKRPDKKDMVYRDYIISQICDAVETWTMLVLPMTGSIIAVFCFYRDKIKEPLEILTEGSRKIQENRLDFPVHYRKKDEMGQLCREFDRMRSQLQENNKKLWNMVEQERTLKAVIAHDIRSPLAVLRGYQETLMEFLPGEQLSEQDTKEILQSGMQQIDRMNAFVEQMRRLSGIEDREIHYEKIETAVLLRYMENTAKVLADREDCRAVIKTEDMPESFLGDYSVICEVFENLLGNAVRYARHMILISLEVSEDKLFICLGDDGVGFHGEEDEITKPFYHDNLADDLKHFGLGMYLSKLYCEKHGGKLLLGSADIGGAYVKAGFHVQRIE